MTSQRPATPAFLVVIRSLPVLALLVASIVVGWSPPAKSDSRAERWQAEGWKTDFSKTTIDLGTILSGGPPKDGIPSIDQPQFKPVNEISDLGQNEPVISLKIGTIARAYPLRILIWHEIVNDEVGGVPVAVTYCPLCNTAIVFSRRLGGTILDFGTTGKLRHSDLVMYDRQTESWWQQFTGEAIAGKLAGQKLTLIPARLVSFSEFRSAHGDGVVLVANDPNFRRYGDNPYVGYDTTGQPFLFRGALPENINPMARVVAVRHETGVFAVSLDFLRRTRVLETNGFRLTWRPGQASALDRKQLKEGRDVGTVHVTRRSGDGTTRDVVYDVTFAFAFHAFHPDIPIRQN